MRFIIVERYADNGELSHRALIDTTDGREVGTDGGEPEDASFWRDWAWVPDELNKHDAALRRAKAEGMRMAAEIAKDCHAHFARHHINMKIAELDAHAAQIEEGE